MNSSPKKPPKEIYVTIDACAKLGGQPYAVLESLHDIYKITGRSNLHYIDTEQGFHEKSNCTIPAFMNIQENNKYTKFLQKNPDWTTIVATEKCCEFREDLAQNIIPKTVQPLIELTEKASNIIQKKAFKLTQKRNLTHLDGKKIQKPEDIDIKISGKDSPVFVGELLNEAADLILTDFWNEEIDKVKALNSDKSKYDKGFMAKMIKAMQETKAFSYELIKQHSPDKFEQIENISKIDSSVNSAFTTYDDRKKISDKSHLFSDIQLPTNIAWWEQHEAIQALRMTNLWPWSLKDNLSEKSKGNLKKAHKNTADESYLKLYTDILPELSDPKNMRFLLLTNDAPLIKQFLEVSTGITKISKKEHHHQIKGQKSADIIEFKQSDIYDELGLTKREPQEYPHQLAIAGSEFVRFAYKEVRDSIKVYIPKNESKFLLKEIENNTITKKKIGDANYILKSLINENTSIPDNLKEALNILLENTKNVEESVKKDIKQHGPVTKAGQYEHRQDALMEKRNGLLQR